MQHGNGLVFERNYQSNNIAIDVCAAVRNQDPQTRLLQAATGLLATKDSRRPWRLNSEQRASIQQHPEVRQYRDALEEYRKWIKAEFGGIRKLKADPGLESIFEEYRILQKSLQAETKAQEAAYLEALKSKFRTEQPIRDIERQLQGLPVEDPDCASSITPARLIPQRTALIPLLLRFLDSTTRNIHVERKTRAEVVTAVSALCKMKNLRQGPTSAARNVNANPKLVTPSSTTHLNSEALFRCLPLQCCFCLRDQSMQLAARTKSYARLDVLTKHLDRYHPQNPESPRKCPECQEPCVHKRHLRKHGQEEHDIVLSNV